MSMIRFQEFEDKIAAVDSDSAWTMSLLELDIKHRSEVYTPVMFKDISSYHSLFSFQ